MLVGGRLTTAQTFLRALSLFFALFHHQICFLFMMIIAAPAAAPKTRSPPRNSIELEPARCVFLHTESAEHLQSPPQQRPLDARPDLIAAKMAATVGQHVKARPTVNASASRAAAPPVNAHLAVSAAVGIASAQLTQYAGRHSEPALIRCYSSVDFLS
jgi:hypothetical protein